MQAMKQFDFRGSFFMTTAITFLILGLNLGGNVLAWTHPFVLTSLAIFAVSFPSFLWIERSASRPIMPLRLIHHSPHANMIFSNFLAAFIMNAILFNMPLYFQAVLLTSATTSGLCLVSPRCPVVEFSVGLSRHRANHSAFRWFPQSLLAPVALPQASW